jgi:hypothetical protein
MVGARNAVSRAQRHRTATKRAGPQSSIGRPRRDPPGPAFTGQRAHVTARRRQRMPACLLPPASAAAASRPYHLTVWLFSFPRHYWRVTTRFCAKVNTIQTRFDCCLYCVVCKKLQELDRRFAESEKRDMFSHGAGQSDACNRPLYAQAGDWRNSLSHSKKRKGLTGRVASAGRAHRENCTLCSGCVPVKIHCYSADTIVRTVRLYAEAAAGRPISDARFGPYGSARGQLVRHCPDGSWVHPAARRKVFFYFFFHYLDNT